MKKKFIVLFSLVLVLVASVFVVKALNPNDPYEVINVTKTGETSHGGFDLRVGETHLAESETGYIAYLDLNVDDGYYVKNLSVKLGENDLQLGFDAGSEQGGFFRHVDFSSGNLEYQFLIPSAATTSNKIEVVIEYAQKAPFDITYLNYTGTSYTDEAIGDPKNYAAEQVLVNNYRDGDLVLPNSCMQNGCALKFTFANESDYNEYEGVMYNPEIGRWFVGSAVDTKTNDNFIDADASMCSKDDLTCYAIIRKGFDQLALGDILFGYTKMNVYSPDFVGFDVEVDVQNFSDIISELGNSTVGFTNDKKEVSIDLFYGTKKLILKKNNPRPIINDGGTNNCPALRSFDNVTGSGYAYDVIYSGDTATVNINSYYQDKLTLEINVLNGSENVLGGPVKINLDRFAFAGNGGMLLEVDSMGRNCRENNNGNTCNQGIYYSTQYRGVLSSFYINENESSVIFVDPEQVVDIVGNDVTIGGRGTEEAYARNTDFNPHAIALFYDKNNMIVETKDFDLNAETPMEGYVSKSVFEQITDGLNVNPQVTGSHVYFTNDVRTTINNISYFSYADATIMHDLVLIGKEEAKEKDIVKIALFLVNGEIEEDSIPKLTYGIGEGRVMEIRGEE